VSQIISTVNHLPPSTADSSTSSSTLPSQPCIAIDVPGFTSQIAQVASNEDPEDYVKSDIQSPKESEADAHKKKGQKQM
jgi:hypothetical protein